MLIQVIYPGLQHDYVKDFMLDALIETRQIIKFRRSSGWVTLGVDPVRTSRREPDYRGIERRGVQHVDFKVEH